MPGPFLPIDIAKAAKKAAADAVRRIPTPDLPELDVPNPFQRTGQVLGEATKKTFKQMTSGEEFVNTIVPGLDAGTFAGEQLERVPKVGGAIRTAFDVGASPVSIGSAGIGPGAQAAFKGLPMAARIPLNLVAPASRSTNFGTRLAAETAIGTAATVGAQETAERTDNPLLIGAAGVGAGVIASGGVSAGMKRAKPAAVSAAADTLPAVPDSPSQALIKRVAEAKPLQSQNKELLGQFRSRQSGAFAGNLGDGESGFDSGLGALKGQAERVGFEPLRPSLGQEGVDTLYETLKGARLRPFEHASAGTALRDILDGRVPTPSELAQLERAFPGLTDSLRKAKIVSGPGVGEYVSDLISVPQSMLSAYDLSGLRQTATAAYGHPVMFGKSFKRSLSALAKEENFKAVNDDLNGRWYADLREQAGVELNASERALAKGEGTIISQTVNKIPGYRPSQRAYTALVNLMRDGVFEKMLEASGDPHSLSPKELQQMGKLANISTGRGSFPKFMEESRLAGTPIFWAPRLVASRFEMPFEAFSSNAIVRKEAIRQMTAFIGANAVMLGAGKAAGAWDVETDPRSADFGQVRLGNQRLDPWFGFRPIANLVARLSPVLVGDTPQRKSTTTGKISDVEAKKVLADFARQKFSPVTQIGVSLATGRDALGNKYGLTDVPEDALLSLFLSDLKEAVKNGGVGDLPKALPAVLGFGTTSYDPEEEKFARLTPSEKDSYLRAHPDLAERLSQERIDGGGKFGQYEAEKVKYAAQQAEADKNISDPLEWKKDYRERQQRIVGSREAILGSGEDDLTTSWGRYYAEVKKNTKNGKPDWDAIETYRAGLDDAENSEIDKETGLGGTPRVREYRKVGRELDKAQYFDIYDRVWARLAPKLGLEEYKTGREFEQALDSRIRERLVQRGITSRADQDILMEKVLDGIEPLKAYRSVVNDVQEAWIKANAGLAKKAIEVGYIDPATLRNAESGAVLGVGR